MPGDDTKRDKSEERSPASAPSQEKELADLCACFADLCQYFSQQNIDLPSPIVDEVRLVSKLSIDIRIARMKCLNQELLEYLNNAGPESQVPQ